MKLVVALIMIFVGSCSIMFNLDPPLIVHIKNEIPKECATMDTHQLDFYKRICNGE